LQIQYVKCHSYLPQVLDSPVSIFKKFLYIFPKYNYPEVYLPLV